jgi:hypothetical protein
LSRRTLCRRCQGSHAKRAARRGHVLKRTCQNRVRCLAWLETRRLAGADVRPGHSVHDPRGHGIVTHHQVAVTERVSSIDPRTGLCGQRRHQAHSGRQHYHNPPRRQAPPEDCPQLLGSGRGNSSASAPGEGVLPSRFRGLAHDGALGRLSPIARDSRLPPVGCGRIASAVLAPSVR